MVRTVGPGCVKIIFTLLAKVVEVHVGFPKIKVEKPSFEKLFLGLGMN